MGNIVKAAASQGDGDTAAETQQRGSFRISDVPPEHQLIGGGTSAGR